MHIDNKHKEIVKKRKYRYLGTYKTKEITIDGKNKKGNDIYIRVKCPYCNTEYDVTLSSFKKGINCTKCCNKYENSFAYYIQIEIKENLNKYWDWEKNELNPYCISKCSNKKIWIKCTKVDYHGSYEVICSHFTDGSRCPYCNPFASHKVHPKDSFGQWGIDNIDPNFVEKYWSDKNSINPFSIAPRSNKKVWIKCQEKDYHGDYLVSCDKFISGERCPYCASRKIHPKDSFAQHHINHTDKDFLVKYWSDKNTVDPFTIAPHSHKKVWIKCVNKDYHEDYKTTCHSYTNFPVCPLCSCTGGKTHPKDSFGSLYPKYVKLWSDKNKISPYEVAISSCHKYWFYCEDCGQEFQTMIRTITKNGRSMKCLNCNSSKGEQRIKDWLVKNNIEFEPQKEFKGLTGVYNKNLRYDFYLPDYNLLIEYQGIQHEKFTKGFHEGKYNFEYQQEHDRRKRMYAIEYNIKLLEIWYYDFDNIEEILENNLLGG